jgi:hypothetical protein
MGCVVGRIGCGRGAYDVLVSVGFGCHAYIWYVYVHLAPTSNPPLLPCLRSTAPHVLSPVSCFLLLDHLPFFPAPRRTYRPRARTYLSLDPIGMQFKLESIGIPFKLDSIGMQVQTQQAVLRASVSSWTWRSVNSSILVFIDENGVRSCPEFI